MVFLLVMRGCEKVRRWSEVIQSCLTLCDPVDYSLMGSSVRGIFQQEYLSEDWTLVFHIVGRHFIVWAIGEVRCESWTIMLDWAPKNWHFWTVVLENPLKSPLGCKEIQPVHPKGNQSWLCIGWTDVEAETPILWPPDAKSWLIWKDPDPGKDWRWEEKRMTEDEMVGWHHRLNGREFE